MTIQKLGMILVGVLLIGGVAWAASRNTESVVTSISPNVTSTQGWECNGDAKICPDGSLVGRTGPNCEFVSCPLPNATSTTMTTYLGGRVTGLNVTVNPEEVVSDSRCPQGVQCVWAGTVSVRTVLSTEVSHGEHVLVLNEPRVFGNYTVTLVEVSPIPKEGEKIPVSSYRFTFEVKKR